LSARTRAMSHDCRLESPSIEWGHEGTKMSSMLGLDLGATFTRLCRIDEHGGELIRLRTPSGYSAARILTRELISLMPVSRSIFAVGLSRAAGLDSAGRVCEWPTRPDWVGVPLVDIIERVAAKKPLSADDGMCAALWEHALEPRDPQSTTACLSIGTGLAVGIVRGGRLIKTGEGSATIGHLALSDLNLPCKCGQKGCLQTVLSVEGLELVRRKFGTTALRGTLWRIFKLLRENYQVDRVVFTGGGVSRFGGSFFLCEAAKALRGARSPRIVVSCSPSLSALGGSLVLGREASRKYCRSQWVRIIRHSFKRFRRLDDVQE
jgi:predicted NBD/HSP70 family sugar kinase